MTPRLIASYFGANPEYERMARVLEYSARQHCPDWDIRVEHTTPVRLESAIRNEGHVENTQKMEHWTDHVVQAADGQALLLMDGDTMVLQSLDPLWSLDFDLAYTDRPGRLPFNTGVVAVRVSPAVRGFMVEWRNEQYRMLRDAAYHRPWRERFGGINQAALGSMLTRQADYGLYIRVLPGQEWNCENGTWATADDRTRVVHTKDVLRRAIFAPAPPLPALGPLVRRWHELEDAAMAGGLMGPSSSLHPSG